MTVPGPNPTSFRLTRDLDAPPELVFSVWTDGDHLIRWFGPKGFERLSADMDARPGGRFHYGLRAPNGEAMWGIWAIQEVVAPERLAFVVSFSDPDGGITRHPWAPDWPLRLLCTVTLGEAPEGGTRLELEAEPVDPTPIERETFAAGHASLTQGWSGTFEQLEAYLATLQGAREGP